MHTRATVVVLTAVIVAAGLAYADVARRPEAPAERPSIDEPDAVRALLRGRIAELGPKGAYDELARDVANDDVPTRHGMAHLFGEMLFENAGTGGIATCDANFTFGCYHGLIARALADGDDASLAGVDAACVAANGPEDTGCRHGIGHGLVERFGAHDLAPSLSACETLRPPGLLGCTQGVFMEFASVAAEEAELIPSDPHEPCASAPAQHRAACWFEQPYLLVRIKGFDAARVAGTCARLAGAERDACMLGFGRMVTEYSNYDLGTATDACNEFDGADRVRCLGGARWLFAAVGKKRPWPCDDIAGAERESCDAASRGISDVGQ